MGIATSAISPEESGLSQLCSFTNVLERVDGTNLSLIVILETAIPGANLSCICPPGNIETVLDPGKTYIGPIPSPLYLLLNARFCREISAQATTQSQYRPDAMHC